MVAIRRLIVLDSTKRYGIKNNSVVCVDNVLSQSTDSLMITNVCRVFACNYTVDVITNTSGLIFS